MKYLLLQALMISSLCLCDDDLEKFIEYKSIESMYYIDNSDSLEWSYYWRGKFNAYQDVLYYINNSLEIN